MGGGGGGGAGEEKGGRGGVASVRITMSGGQQGAYSW